MLKIQVFRSKLKCLFNMLSIWLHWKFSKSKAFDKWFLHRMENANNNNETESSDRMVERIQFRAKPVIWAHRYVNSKKSNSIVTLITDDIMVFNLCKLVIEFYPLANFRLAKVASIKMRRTLLEFEVSNVLMQLVACSDTVLWI